MKNTNYVTPRPYKAPLHAHKREPIERKAESHLLSVCALVVVIFILGLILGGVLA